MDPSTRQKAIEDETLSNDEAIIELYTRRDNHAAADHSQAHHAEIARLLEAGVLDAQKAVAVHEPVVKVLKRVLVDMGRVLFAAKQAEERVSNAAKMVKYKSSAAGVALPSSTESEVNRAPPARPLSSEHDPRLLQIQNNLKARNPQWSKEKTEKTASDHLAQILTKHRAIAEAADQPSDLARFPEISDNLQGGNMATNSSPVQQQQQQRMSQQNLQADIESKNDTPPVPPSRSVSPSRPISSMHEAMSTPIATSSAAAFASAFTPAKRPPSIQPKVPASRRRKTELEAKEPARRNRRKKPKSEKLVVESDDSDVEMKGSDTATPFEAGVIDPSEGLSGFENLDENGMYVQKPHARFVLVNGKPRDAFIVKLKVSPEKLQAILQKRTDLEQGKTSLDLAAPRSKLSPLAIEHQKTQSKRRPALNESSVSSSTPNGAAFSPGGFDSPNGPNAVLPTSQTASEFASDDEDPTWESDEETTTTTAPTAEVVFPSLPSLSAAHLPPFMKGLVIAIENIITDHAEKPDATLLELVQQLEEDKPTLPAGSDGRRIVMDGGEYVYAAVHKICAEARPANDAAKDSGVDADGDTAMSGPSPEDNADPTVDVKLTDQIDGITPLPEKAHYKGRGRAWKKTPGDADPGFRAQNKINMMNMPKRVLRRRKATHGGQNSAWQEQGIEALFERFCAHVKGEYWFHAGRMGVRPDKDVLPEWLWSN